MTVTARHEVLLASATCAAVAALLAFPGPAQAQSRARATPPRSPVAVGRLAPRPPAASDHEPRLRPGRSLTAGRTSLAAPPNVARRPNVGGVGGTLGHLPGPFTRIRVGGRIFFFCLGGFYVRHHGGYEAVEPPVGAAVGSLPAGYETLELGGRALFYYDGVFYERGRRADEYVVVPAPPGAVVGHLPYDAVETRIGGRIYYVARGVYYLPVRRNGELAYVVTVP